ncbi:hypothetical protein PR048_019434 [Dryococelus australis]|uniref:Uncharacterized protein n=1 Tax=Dryococelus australis TaxID=614101 RepID=A0ABQ9H3J2_9NEOP|nr:hypothetical protein PR048_019434 [Dryococelus australis]
MDRKLQRLLALRKTSIPVRTQARRKIVRSNVRKRLGDEQMRGESAKHGPRGEQCSAEGGGEEGRINLGPHFPRGENAVPIAGATLTILSSCKLHDSYCHTVAIALPRYQLELDSDSNCRLRTCNYRRVNRVASLSYQQQQIQAANISLREDTYMRKNAKCSLYREQPLVVVGSVVDATHLVDGALELLDFATYGRLVEAKRCMFYIAYYVTFAAHNTAADVNNRSAHAQLKEADKASASLDKRGEDSLLPLHHLPPRQKHMSRHFPIWQLKFNNGNFYNAQNICSYINTTFLPKFHAFKRCLLVRKKFYITSSVYLSGYVCYDDEKSVIEFRDHARKILRVRSFRINRGPMHTMSQVRFTFAKYKIAYNFPNSKSLFSLTLGAMKGKSGADALGERVFSGCCYRPSREDLQSLGPSLNAHLSTRTVRGEFSCGLSKGTASSATFAYELSVIMWEVSSGVITVAIDGRRLIVFTNESRLTLEHMVIRCYGLGRHQSCLHIFFSVLFTEGIEKAQRYINELLLRVISSQRTGFNSQPGHSGISQVGIVPDGVAGRRVFSGIARFPHPCILVLLHSHLMSPSSALRTSSFRTAQICVANKEKMIMRAILKSTHYLFVFAATVTLANYDLGQYDGLRIICPQNCVNWVSVGYVHCYSYRDTNISNCRRPSDQYESGSISKIPMAIDPRMLGEFAFSTCARNVHDAGPSTRVFEVRGANDDITFNVEIPSAQQSPQLLPSIWPELTKFFKMIDDVLCEISLVMWVFHTASLTHRVIHVLASLFRSVYTLIAKVFNTAAQRRTLMKNEMPTWKRPQQAMDMDVPSKKYYTSGELIHATPGQHISLVDGSAAMDPLHHNCHPRRQKFLNFLSQVTSHKRLIRALRPGRISASNEVNTYRIPCYLFWGKAVATANEQITEARVHKGQWSPACCQMNLRNYLGNGVGLTIPLPLQILVKDAIKDFIAVLPISLVRLPSQKETEVYECSVFNGLSNCEAGFRYVSFRTGQFTSGLDVTISDNIEFSVMLFDNFGFTTAAFISRIAGKLRYNAAWFDLASTSIPASCLMPEAIRWKYGLPANCWPTVSVLRRLDIAAMPGLRRLDVVTMPVLRRLDVVTMPGLIRLGVVTMPGLRRLDVVTMAGLWRLDVVTMTGRVCDGWMLDVATMPGLRRLDVVTMPGLRWPEVISIPDLQLGNVQISDSSTSGLVKKERAVNSVFGYSAKHIHLGRNAFIFNGFMWMFLTPYPHFVPVHLTICGNVAFPKVNCFQTTPLAPPVRGYLNEMLPQLWIGRGAAGDQALHHLPPRSLDLTSRVLFLGGYIKDQMFHPTLPANIDSLKTRITDTIQTVTSDMWIEFEYRVDVVRAAHPDIHGRHSLSETIVAIVQYVFGFSLTSKREWSADVWAAPRREVMTADRIIPLSAMLVTPERVKKVKHNKFSIPRRLQGGKLINQFSSRTTDNNKHSSSILRCAFDHACVHSPVPAAKAKSYNRLFFFYFVNGGDGTSTQRTYFGSLWVKETCAKRGNILALALLSFLKCQPRGSVINVLFAAEWGKKEEAELARAGIVLVWLETNETGWHSGVGDGGREGLEVEADNGVRDLTAVEVALPRETSDDTKQAYRVKMNAENTSKTSLQQVTDFEKGLVIGLKRAVQSTVSFVRTMMCCPMTLGAVGAVDTPTRGSTTSRVDRRIIGYARRGGITWRPRQRYAPACPTNSFPIPCGDESAIPAPVTCAVINSATAAAAQYTGQSTLRTTPDRTRRTGHAQDCLRRVQTLPRPARFPGMSRTEHVVGLVEKPVTIVPQHPGSVTHRYHNCVPVCLRTTSGICWIPRRSTLRRVSHYEWVRRAFIDVQMEYHRYTCLRCSQFSDKMKCDNKVLACCIVAGYRAARCEKRTMGTGSTEINTVNDVKQSHSLTAYFHCTAFSFERTVTSHAPNLTGPPACLTYTARRNIERSLFSLELEICQRPCVLLCYVIKIKNLNLDWNCDVPRRTIYVKCCSSEPEPRQTAMQQAEKFRTDKGESSTPIKLDIPVIDTQDSELACSVLVVLHVTMGFSVHTTLLFFYCAGSCGKVQRRPISTIDARLILSSRNVCLKHSAMPFNDQVLNYKTQIARICHFRAAIPSEERVRASQNGATSDPRARLAYLCPRTPDSPCEAYTFCSLICSNFKVSRCVIPYDIRKVFPSKAAIGSEAHRAGLINCDPITNVTSLWSRKGSSTACSEEPSEHSLTVILGNHAKPKSGWPYQDSNPGTPECESIGLPLYHLDLVPVMAIRVRAAPGLGYRVSLRHMKNALDYSPRFSQRDSGCVEPSRW